MAAFSRRSRLFTAAPGVFFISGGPSQARHVFRARGFCFAALRRLRLAGHLFDFRRIFASPARISRARAFLLHFPWGRVGGTPRLKRQLGRKPPFPVV